MKVLAVHNYYQQRGGEDAVFDAETALLNDRGHAVTRFTRHSAAIGNAYRVALAAAGSIWNRRVYSEIRELARGIRPDVVHVHNVFPLISPSVYHAAKAEGVPIVQTLHNYRLRCPKGTFYRSGAVCELCSKGPLPWRSIVYACYHGSHAASAVLTTSLATHAILRTFSDKIDVFIAPTSFVKEKFVSLGMSPDAIRVKPHFIPRDDGGGTGSGQYALFVGRLSEEKGVRTLLEALALSRARIPLKVVGSGPLADEISTWARPGDTVEPVGPLARPAVVQLMKDAAFVIVPSESYETFGNVVIEAFSAGTPVIAADLGAVRELVRPGETGLLFEAGNPSALASAIDWLHDRPEELRHMRLRARQEFLRSYTAARNYSLLLDIYEYARRRAGREAARALAG